MIALRLAFLIVVMLSAACSNDPVPGLLEQAETAETVGDLPTAIEHYRAAAELAPKNGLVHWRLGKALLAVRDGAAAETAIRTADWLGAGIERTLPALAQALYLQDKHDELLRLTAEGLDATNTSILLAYQARSHIALDRLDMAERLLKQADMLSPYAPEVSFAHAELSTAYNAVDDATDYLRQVLMVDPDYVYALAQYGELAELRGDREDALKYYTQAIENNYDHWRDRLLRGRLYLKQHNYTDALADARQLLRQVPDNARVLMFAYRTHAALGQLNEAAEMLQTLVRHHPRHVEAKYQLARVELRRGRIDSAESLARAAHTLDATHLPARKLLAAMLLGKGDHAEAEALLSPADGALALDGEATRLLVLSLLGQDKASDAQRVAGVLVPNIEEPDATALLDAIAKIGTDDQQAGIDTMASLLGIDPIDLDGPRLADNTQVAEFSAAAATISPADRFLDEARSYLTSGNLAAAATALENALIEEPANLEALEGLLSVSLAMDSQNDVQAALDRALKIKPQDSRLLTLSADYAEATEDWDSFVSAIETVLSKYPSRNDLRARLAMYQLMHAKSPAKARQLLAGHEDSTSADLQAVLAETYYQQNQLNAATKTFHALRVIAPAYTASYLRLAAIYRLKGNTGGVRAMLQRLVKLAPHDEYANLARARLLAMDNDIDGAEQRVAATRLAASDPEVIRTRLLIAQQAARFNTLRQLAEELWLAEKSVSALRYLTDALRHSDEWETSITLLTEWTQKHPDDVNALTDLAACYASTGQRDEKIRVLEHIADIDPENAGNLNNLAWSLRDSDPQRAEQLARRASELDPQSIQIADTLVAVLARNQQYPDAIQQASNAIRNSDEPARLLLRRAELFLIAGQADDALNDLRSIDPSDMPYAARERRMHLLHALRN